MTEEETVRATFPQAEIRSQRPVPGADVYYERDGLFAGPALGPGTKLLGRGPTEPEAWAVAQAGG
ncbi:MAG TPA: hypothetical protein VM597_40010 [Gemmataceae bacterium]|nr:hypothetical protein [Gemmataceae bacterium]